MFLLKQSSHLITILLIKGLHKHQIDSCNQDVCADAGFRSLCSAQPRCPPHPPIFIKRGDLEKLTCETTEQFNAWYPESSGLSASGVCCILIVLGFHFWKRMISKQRFNNLFSPLAIDSFSLLVRVLRGNVISNLKEMSSCTSYSPTQFHCMMPQLPLSIIDETSAVGLISRRLGCTCL